LKTKLTIAIASILAVPFQVQAEHEQLPTIVVEGSAMRSGTFGTAPDSSGLKDTASLLKRVPGANVNRNGPLTGIASYRGMFGNRINISIDGANMKEVGPNSMDPPLSHIPAPLTGKLTVHRGIAPVSSGIESFGGSMHAESKKGRFAEGDGIETSGTASIGYGSVDDGHFGAILGAVATKNHKLYLSGSKEQGRDYKIKDNDKQEGTQYDREAFTAGYGYQREGHEFGINYSNNNTGHTGTPALPMDIVYVRGGLYDANYSWDLGDGYKVRTNVFYQKMRHWMDSYTLRDSAMNMWNRTEVEAGGIDLAVDMPLFGGTMTVGVNGDQSNHEANSAMESGMNPMNFFHDIERDRYSIFTEWAGDVSENMALELGARFVHTWSDAGDVTGGDTTVVPMPEAMAVTAAQKTMRMMQIASLRTGNDRDDFNDSDRKRNFNEVDLAAVLRYSVSSSLDVEVGLARKNRAPTYQELYLWTGSRAVGGFADGHTYLGDIDLDHETAYQFDLGFDWHNENAYIAPRFFYHYVDDYIQGVRTQAALDSGATLQWSNIAAQFYGVDLEAGYTITDNWRVDAGLNYVRGERVNAPGSDSDLYRIAPLNGRVQATYEQHGWMGAIEGVFYADQGDVAGYNDEQKTKGYMLLNLRGKYEPYHGVVIGTGIENVVGSKHYDHLGGYTNHNRNGDRVAMPGRNIYATLAYNW